MSRRRGLSAEDRKLWAKIAATAVPLRTERQATAAPQPAPARAVAFKPSVNTRAENQKPSKPETQLTKFRVGQQARIRPGAIDRVSSPAEILRDGVVRMDGKVHRRMVRGKVTPDARIDLHGMTLAIAQPSLTRFILDSHVAGRRLVLVITGKGRTGSADAPLPVRPGALRHFVPHWLHSAPLARVVLQVTPAHQRHGGEGAYYVYLRR